MTANIGAAGVGAGLRPAQPKQRKTLRLPDFDYKSPGAYFVTICVKDRKPVLAKLDGEVSKLTRLGLVVKEVWNRLPNHYVNIDLDEFIIMPNHIHGILWIKDNSIPGFVGAGLRPAQSPREGLRPSPTNSHDHSLTEIVRSFKSFSSREINKQLTTNKFSWQRGFYEHIIRDEDDLYNIRSYIRNNPLKWEQDEYHQ